MLSIVLEPSLVHWTKLFWIDVLLYKNKTSQVTSIIYAFFAFELYQISHMEKIFSCWSRKEDLLYGVSKHGNEITKVCKINVISWKRESQNEEYRDVFVDVLKRIRLKTMWCERITVLHVNNSLRVVFAARQHCTSFLVKSIWFVFHRNHVILRTFVISLSLDTP